ncbi:MAG: helix-turn-helix transcriptional regulator [Niabella sp.]|nr:helix-turn-helix transcriptional regulator [Niabella sp.]
MEINKLVGLRIADLRAKKGLSQQRFAYEAEVERSYLSRVEKGEKNISLKTFGKIIAALGVSYEGFFNQKELEGLCQKN